jgi:hypothetical protein
MGHQAISDIAPAFIFLPVIIFFKAEAAPQDSPEPSGDNLTGCNCAACTIKIQMKTTRSAMGTCHLFYGLKHARLKSGWSVQVFIVLFSCACFKKPSIASGTINSRALWGINLHERDKIRT